MVVDKRLYRNPVQRVLRTGRQGCAQGHLCDRDKVRLIRFATASSWAAMVGARSPEEPDRHHGS